MTGFERYENLLRLFLDRAPLWSVAELSQSLGTSASNVYRTVRELVAAGFLEAAEDSRYRLGPIFLEFERHLRRSDPLVRSGSVFLAPLVEQAGIPCCAALARLYGDTVMCVADAQSPRFDAKTSYERGRPMPILRGATSKAVLSVLPARKRDRIIAAAVGDAPGEAEALRSALSAIRKAGIVKTVAEVDPDLAGIAVPISPGVQALFGSLSLIVRHATLTPEIEARLGTILHSHASLIESYVRMEVERTS
ncbi:IclR family transcriptional regulator [Frigidibacter oleivorans]|uniref:IclR family transcriptional regulator n=1 Tax=Frigidibacter oleivorans TaxID=2487129 RepID=UPI000F8CC537|nr:IclR family transcriptional regulator C-terminal domain-containing protein [Frigidibacter oleivorans]